MPGDLVTDAAPVGLSSTERLPAVLHHIAQPSAPIGRFGRRVILPLAVFVAGAMALVLAFVLIASVRQDAIALDASTRLAQTALIVKEREISRTLQDYAVWEDVYRHLHVELDLEWAATDGNVGANIYKGLGYSMAFVIAPGGRTVYAVINGEPRPADAFSYLPHGLDSFVHQAAIAPPGSLPLVGMLHSESDVVMVSAGAILPAPLAAMAPSPDNLSILVFVKPLDRDFLTRMGDQYLLANLVLQADPAGPLQASLPLTSPDGAMLGYLAWTPERPGHELLRMLLPPLLLALIGLTIFASLVLRSVRRSAHAFEASARTIEAYARTLESTQSRFRDVAEASSDWIWEADPDLRFTYLSSRFSEVTGVAAATVLGKSVEQFFSSDIAAEGWPHLHDATHERLAFRDLRYLYRDAAGRSRVCRLAGRPIVDQEGGFQGYRGTAADITVEVEAQARAQHLALHDALTGLPNRVLLRERLELALAGRRRDRSRVAVLCLDLDNFKEVNDTLGHGAGDLLLKEVALRLHAAVRTTDTVARLGGDEFAVVQVSVDQPSDARSLCRRLVECLRPPVRIDGQEIYVSASIGVALTPDDGGDHQLLLKNADIALYRAKQAGRGVFRFFEPQMDAELQARKLLEQDLRQALVRGQFELHYQPLVAIEGQHLMGLEALLRWTHPQRGQVPPKDFIPIAEETGLINVIGEWVLRTACRHVRNWPNLIVSVNLSPVQFKSGELVETINAILNETGVAADRLELEITENVLLYDTSTATKALTALKQMGVRIALDDFGTGYSSLGYLNCFPFDKLKIDRSFITELNDKAKADAIVRSVIRLGESLGMITIAEGVETQEQLTFLMDEGCQQVQGFYFGRPMPADDVSAFIAEWTKSFGAAMAA